MPPAQHSNSKGLGSRCLAGAWHYPKPSASTALSVADRWKAGTPASSRYRGRRPPPPARPHIVCHASPGLVVAERLPASFRQALGDAIAQPSLWSQGKKSARQGNLAWNLGGGAWRERAVLRAHRTRTGIEGSSKTVRDANTRCRTDAEPGVNALGLAALDASRDDSTGVNHCTRPGDRARAQRAPAEGATDVLSVVRGYRWNVQIGSDVW